MQDESGESAYPEVRDFLMMILLAAWQSSPQWLSWGVLYAVFVTNLVLDAWLLIILYRQDARKHLPWFVFYVIWEFLSACVGLTTWLINRRLFVALYWWMEGPRVALMVGAVRESFLRTFVGFTALRWFPWLVRSVIAFVVLYSAWKAIYVPPIQSNRIVSFILGAEFAFRWGIAAIGFLSMVLIWLFDLTRHTKEDAVISGCGLASIVFVAWVLSRSFFGTRFIFFTQYLPDMGYFVAAWIWIRTFLHPAEEFGLKELDLNAEQIAQELRRYGEAARRILRK